MCIVTLETDLRNPLVLKTMRYWQGHGRIGPPAPVTVDRMKDWRPVWEWRNRNPDVSDREIAEMLGLHRVTVSRALERLDKENAPGST